MVELLERDYVVERINEILNGAQPKFTPIVICSSRGMGKTYLLKCIGAQHLKPALQNTSIERAKNLGRVLSVDASMNDVSEIVDNMRFLQHLIAHHLCSMFSGTEVDGIRFNRAASLNSMYQHMISEGTSKLGLWLRNLLLSASVSVAVSELIRMTNLAFEAQDVQTLPLILIDEVQTLTNITNKRSQRGFHTHFSYLLTQLSIHPIPCVCAGTNTGALLEIAEASSFVPCVMSLTTLHQSYETYWQNMTNELNTLHGCNISVNGDLNVVEALTFASYQIPRLLFLAHDVWYSTKLSKKSYNLEYIVQKFEEKALFYYSEMKNFLLCSELTINDLVHIMLAGGVFWRLDNPNSFIPGTKIKWSMMIEWSVLFPYTENAYIFPFRLVWNSAHETQDLKSRKRGIQNHCASLIPNLDLESLFPCYEDLCKWDYYNLGVFYESLFISSFVARYHLRKVDESRQQNSSAMNSINTTGRWMFFTSIYDFSADDETNYDRMSEYEVDVSEGILLDENENFVTNTIPPAFIHNKKIRLAHHDGLLKARKNGHPQNLAVQFKASFQSHSAETLLKQKKISRTSNQSVSLLIWVYLGKESHNTQNEKDVVYLDGAGCCNGLALDMLILLKKLKSGNNRITDETE